LYLLYLSFNIGYLDILINRMSALLWNIYILYRIW
jgi:hypothetical protein